MLASHYAPGAAVRLEAVAVGRGEALLAFGPHRAKGAGEARRLPQPFAASGDLREAAANLFCHLQALDRSGAGDASPSSRSPMPASARRSTTGCAAPPRRVTSPPCGQWP